MINAIRIEEGGPALDAVDLVSLLQKKFSQIGTVLAGDAGNKCAFLCHINAKKGDLYLHELNRARETEVKRISKLN